MKKIKGLLMLGVVAVTAFSLAGCGKTTVNLNKYVTITAEGYDSMGRADYRFDTDAFNKDYSGKIKLSNEGAKELASYGLYSSDVTGELLLDFCVEQSLDKKSGLSNGDVVTLKWDCEDSKADKFFNCKLDYSDVAYTVSGLKEVGKFNPFDHVTVSFSGTSPNGSAKIVANNDKPEMQYIKFTSNKSGGLKVGDKVTVTASISGSTDSFIQQFGEVLGKTEETYTVDGLARYISDISEIPKDTYDKMDKQLQDYFNSYAAKNWVSGASAQLSLVGNYFLTLKEGMSGSPNNYEYFVYKVTMNDGFTYYWYGYFKDAMLLADGTCTVDLSGYTASTSSSTWGITSGDYLATDDSHYVAGFADLDTLFNRQIVSKIDKYEYKSTIQQ